MVSSMCQPRWRLAVVALVTAVIIVETGSDNENGSDADFRRWLPEVLELLCPYSRTCRGGKPRLQLDEGKESCCTECSCEDSCGLTENCCYPEQATIRHFDRSQQQCERPTTRTGPMLSVKYFYMVTRGFGNGIGEDCGNAHTTCGENETASVLGSLYPVSSKTNGIIYKNEQCARCHGVARGDMMPWKAVMTCPALEAGKIGIVLQSLETGHVHATCVLDFYYPGPQFEANNYRCYENTQRSCSQYEGKSYYLPSYLNMTDNEVRAACLTGPQAQYRAFRDFYNVFCFLCDYAVFQAGDQCNSTETGLREYFPGTFSALLGSSFLEQKHYTKRTDKDARVQIPIACKRQNGSQIILDTDDCKLALCPTGKVRLGAACVYHTETLFSRNFKVTLNLYPGDNTHISPLIDHLRPYLHPGEDWRAFIVAPGLEPWRMTDLCYHDGQQQAMHNGQTGSFLLKVKLKKKNTSTLSEILASVNKFMTKDWEFINNMTFVPLERRFSQFNDISDFQNAYNRDMDISQVSRSRDLPEVNCSVHEVVGDDSLSITKLFFCEQIALRPGEYIMDEEKVVFVNATGRVFSPAEYSLGFDTNGDPMPRLCLEDTDYVLMPMQYPASPTIATSHGNWLFVTSVVIARLISTVCFCFYSPAA